MLPTTVERVPASTADYVNDQIRRRTEENIERYRSASPEEIHQRLRELDEEWDIERTLEANASIVALIGLGLGTFVDKRFYALPAAVAAFLLQHALHGWCPPVPILRRLGFRTQPEIEAERYELESF